MRRLVLGLVLGCLLLVAGASALDGYGYYQTIEYAGCDQDVYQQDIVIHRSTGTAYNKTAGGLETWHIYVGEHCREDYGDVRLTNSTGAELAHYLWPDYSSSSARFAVRLEAADQSGALTVHYGNPATTTTSDGDATYILYDPFDTIDPNKWDTSALQSATIVDGCLVTEGKPNTWGNYNAAAIAECPVSGAFHAETKLSWVGRGSDLGELFLYLKSSGSRVYGGIWDAWLSSTLQDCAAIGSSVYKSDSSSSSGAGDMTISIIRDSGGMVTVYLNGVSRKSGVWTDAIEHLHLTNTHQTTYNGKTAKWDYILIRAYSATPPASLTFSGERETPAPPVTRFTANTTAGLAPLTVQFTDASAGSPTSWSWSFGDGNTSTDQNPQHTYAAPGTYSVTLTATNEYGSDYELKTDYITVYGPVTAQFSATPTGGTAPVTIQFTDLSTGGPTSWSWTFGDGNTSTAQNPQHTYTVAGTHTVSLTASHPYDSDTETKPAYITIAVLQPFPGLALIPRDLAGTGLYTDINGNGRLDFDDVIILYQVIINA
jgi:PKD repeat protein